MHRQTRRSLFMGGGAALFVACGASTSSGAPAKSAAPVTLLMPTDHSGPNMDAQVALLGRFGKDRPNVSFELSPNGPNQSARERVKVMAQAGTPPDFWETTRHSAANGPMDAAVQPDAAPTGRDAGTPTSPGPGTARWRWCAP